MVLSPRRRASITEAKSDLKAISETCVKVLAEEFGFIENSRSHIFVTHFGLGTMTELNIAFEEGKECPVTVEGTGGGLSISPNGDMLLVGSIPSPSNQQVEAWGGKWRAKLISESEFPSIPIFAIGSEDWILETPCNPYQMEQEAPGFCEALYAKDECSMAAILVDSDTGIIKKNNPCASG